MELKIKNILLPIAAIFSFITACNSQNKSSMNIKTETVNYVSDGVNLTGVLAYDSNITSKRPIVLIIHEWWGLNDYMKNRVNQIAQLGYLAMAIDLYGNGNSANSVEEAAALSAPLYQNSNLAKSRFDAAITKVKTYSQADTTQIAAIGYCFGGAMALNMARMGEPLTGVVSFHGSLIGVPAKKELMTSKILICHGEEDKFVKKEEVEAFKKEMDDIGADYIFKQYPNATHAFSNPAATEWGKKFNIPIAYNAAADQASWKEMQLFLNKIFK